MRKRISQLFLVCSFVCLFGDTSFAYLIDIQTLYKENQAQSILYENSARYVDYQEGPNLITTSAESPSNTYNVFSVDGRIGVISSTQPNGTITSSAINSFYADLQYVPVNNNPLTDWAEFTSLSIVEYRMNITSELGSKGPVELRANFWIGSWDWPALFSTTIRDKNNNIVHSSFITYSNMNYYYLNPQSILLDLERDYYITSSLYTCYRFDTGHFYTNGIGISYQTQETAPVPEPATMFLLGAGLLSLVGFKKKIKR